MDLKPTTEQQQVIDASTTGNSLKVNAFAGTGKTSLLRMVGNHLKKEKGLYIGFNKSIVEEAKTKFPNTVKCMTAHGLAFGQVGRDYSDRLGRLFPNTVIKELNLTGGKYSLWYLVSDAIELLNEFTYSRYKSILDMPGTNADVAKLANQLWERMIDKKGKIPITHDIYLKLWGLGKVSLPYDYILFDEAQDSNGVMIDVVERQNCRKIWVGDMFQQIYAFRGAENAMEIIDGDMFWLTESFRFNDDIAYVANSILDSYLGVTQRLKGRGTATKTNSPKVVLCRTNKNLLTLVIEAIKNKQPAMVLGGVNDLINLVRSANDLMAGKKVTNKDLYMFKTWNELVEYSDSNLGRDLKLLVSAIRSNGGNDLIKLLEKVNAVTTSNAKVIYSTVHKAKGLEWEQVQLSHDFWQPSSKAVTLNISELSNYKELREEINLLYVASTRAKSKLDYYSCEAVKRALATGLGRN